MPTEAAIQQVWITTLIIYGVVVAVVATLLTLILIAARRIHAGVWEIWNVGQKVANNTIHIALLLRTNQAVEAVLQSAVRVAGAVGAVERHAASCAHCPTCLSAAKRGTR